MVQILHHNRHLHCHDDVQLPRCRACHGHRVNNIRLLPFANPAVDPQEFSTAGGNVSYFFMATALMQGLGNFFWIPLTNKYGRRPAYLASYTIDTASAIWLCLKKNIQGLCSWSNCYGLALVPLRPSVR
jgi:MFS family permease